MAFGRLHEEAQDDPKLLALSDAAWRMWGCAVIYAQKHLTDGFIPEHIIHTFGVRAINKRHVAKELCTVLVDDKGPLWHQAPGGYRIHDYLDWNDSRTEILAARAGSKTRVQRYRDRMAASRNASCNALPDASLDALQTLYKDCSNALQNASRDGAHELENASRNAGGVPSLSPSHSPNPSQHDPRTHTDRAREATEPPRGRRRHSLLDGTLPHDHNGHAWCGNYRKCVPSFLHTEFIGSLGGDPAVATQRLEAFYGATIAAIPDDAVISEPAPQFWRARFQVAFPSTVTPPVTPRRGAPAGPAHTEADPTKYAGRMAEDEDLTEQPS